MWSCLVTLDILNLIKASDTGNCNKVVGIDWVVLIRNLNLRHCFWSVDCDHVSHISAISDFQQLNSANNLLLKVSNRNIRKRGEIGQWRRSGVFTVNFELVSHLFLVFLLLNLSMYLFVVNVRALHLSIHRIPFLK